MAPSGAKKDDEKGVAEVVNDLWQLVRDYAKQETIDPLKQVLRFLGWGLGGAFLVAIGMVFASLAVLRGLQTQTGHHLTGSNSWIPYLVTIVVDAVVIGLAVLAISKPFRSEEHA